MAAVTASGTGDDGTTGHILVRHYTGGYLRVANSTYRTTWPESFNSFVGSDNATTAWLLRHHYAGSSAVCWCTSDEWLSMEADLRTTLPTVALFNDRVLLGGTGRMGPYLRHHRPRLIVVQNGSGAPFPGIAPVLRKYYRPVYRNRHEDVYLQRA